MGEMLEMHVLTREFDPSMSAEEVRVAPRNVTVLKGIDEQMRMNLWYRLSGLLGRKKVPAPLWPSSKIIPSPQRSMRFAISS